MKTNYKVLMILTLVAGAGAGWAAGRIVPRYGDVVHSKLNTHVTYSDVKNEIWGLQLEALSVVSGDPRLTYESKNASPTLYTSDYYGAHPTISSRVQPPLGEWTKFVFSYWARQRPYVSPGQTKFDIHTSLDFACRAARMEWDRL
jgi:hypothetical protein